MSWAILVVWNDGEEEYLHEGLGTQAARFSSRIEAQRQADFMKIGMSDETQSISVVRFPRLHPAKHRRRSSIDIGGDPRQS
jgi:hypothetical protein